LIVPGVLQALYYLDIGASIAKKTILKEKKKEEENRAVLMAKIISRRNDLFQTVSGIFIDLTKLFHKFLDKGVEIL
jgi:hypothetical protein